MLINPFLEDFRIRLIRQEIPMRVLDMSGENVYDVHSKGVRYKSIDIQPCTLVYEDKGWSTLGYDGLRGLMFIIQHIRSGRDVIRLDYRRCTSAIGMSNNSWANALKELEEWGYIAKKRGSDYWVNPAKIFRGNRRKAFPKHIETI